MKKSMDKSRPIPVSQRMCATLHRNSTLAAHGAHQPPETAAWQRRSAIRPGKGARTL
jgi:hypothetical protein